MPSPSKKRQIGRKLKVVDDKKNGGKKVQEVVKEEVSMGAKIQTLVDRPDIKPEDVGVDIPKVAVDPETGKEAPLSELLSSQEQDYKDIDQHVADIRTAFPLPNVLRGVPDVPTDPRPTVTAAQQAIHEAVHRFPVVHALVTDVDKAISTSDEDTVPDIHPFNPDRVKAAKVPKKGVKWEDLGKKGMDPAGFLEQLPLWLYEERLHEHNIEELTKLKKDIRDKIDTALIVTQIPGEVVVGQYAASRVVPTKKGKRFDLDAFKATLLAWGVDAAVISGAEAAATFETPPSAPYVKVRELAKPPKDEQDKEGGEGEDWSA